ncbi:hypothetical protein BDV97DRAFT_395049 [Delphinella strobiligena]|nr:hypothetical protein BDV97DRAFT_395049 [Delphinella strobiligena]
MRKQQWVGDLVILQYWNAQVGSRHHVQHTDVGRVKRPARRFPHLSGFGETNLGETDSGANDEFLQEDDGRFVPVRRRTVQCVVYAPLWFISPLAGAASVWIYIGAFYGVKFNKSAVANGLKKPFLNLPFFKRHDFEKTPEYELAYQPKMAMFGFIKVFRKEQLSKP